MLTSKTVISFDEGSLVLLYIVNIDPAGTLGSSGVAPCSASDIEPGDSAPSSPLPIDAVGIRLSRFIKLKSCVPVSSVNKDSEVAFSADSDSIKKFGINNPLSFGRMVRLRFLTLPVENR